VFVKCVCWFILKATGFYFGSLFLKVNSSMIIFGIDLAKVNWYMILYILASIVGLVYGTNKVYATGQTRGVIFAIGALIVLVYFGLRWFGSRIVKPKHWPPVINMCPDYLTYVSSLPGCVDMLGVSRSSSGITKTLPSEVGSVSKSNTQKVFEFTSEDIRAAKTESDLETICNRCRTAGLTWEGVYDGDVCIAIGKHKSDTEDKERCLISV
jgi:hypothetical protein